MYQKYGPWLKMGQIGTKWGTNVGLFKIWFPHLLTHWAKMYWNLIWKSPWSVLFGANITHFETKSDSPDPWVNKLDELIRWVSEWCARRCCQHPPVAAPDRPPRGWSRSRLFPHWLGPGCVAATEAWSLCQWSLGDGRNIQWLSRSRVQVQDSIAVHFGSESSESQNLLESDLKKSQICPIWGQSDPLWSQTWYDWSVVPDWD